MSKPEKPVNEKERLVELRSLGILDSAAEDRFDRITRLAQRLFDVPTALVSLIDEDRQWFKSRVGLDIEETPREVSFCAHAILQDEVLMVPDATKDERFSDNPHVLGNPNIRFYAGAPIAGPDGAKLGTFCIIDQQPRELSAEELTSLRELAEMVEHEVATSAMAVTDAMTGLGNRRGFESASSMVIAINQRRSVDSTLLYLDLDKLKTINDQFGHAEGDHALREFGELLRDVFRHSDVIARLGGDEFAVLLSGESEHEQVVSRFQEALKVRNQSRAHPYRLAASIGVAVLRSSEHETLEKFIQRADEAMYEEKRRR